MFLQAGEKWMGVGRRAAAADVRTELCWADAGVCRGVSPEPHEGDARAYTLESPGSFKQESVAQLGSLTVLAVSASMSKGDRMASGAFRPNVCRSQIQARALCSAGIIPSEERLPMSAPSRRPEIRRRRTRREKILKLRKRHAAAAEDADRKRIEDKLHRLELGSPGNKLLKKA